MVEMQSWSFKVLDSQTPLRVLVFVLCGLPQLKSVLEQMAATLIVAATG